MQETIENRTRMSPSVRSIALLTLVAFIATQVFLPAPRGFSQYPSAPKGGLLTVQARQGLGGKLIIPPELGTEEEIYQGIKSTKTVFFIQDAHDSLEAQENITKIIEHLVTVQDVKTVLEEGYEGPVPTDEYFGFIKDPELKRKVSYFFLDHLRIGGAEYAFINRTKDFKLIGADSIKLHKKNIEQYRLSSSKKETITKDLKALETEIQALASKRFSKEFFEWLKLKDRFDAKKIDLLDYLGRTMQLLAEKNAFLENRFGFIRLLLEAQSSKDSVVMEKVKHIEAREIYAELSKLEEAMGKAYLRDTRDQELFGYYKVLELLNRLNNLQVTQEEYEAVKKTLQSFNTESLGFFIHKNTQKPIVLSIQWERDVQDAIGFYEIAKARDNAMEQKLDEFIKNPKEATAILVFGGFHKENIKRILESKGIAYKVINPRITKEDTRHHGYYKQLMVAGHYSFELPANIRIATRAESRIEVWDTNPALARAELQTLTSLAEEMKASSLANFSLAAEYVLVLSSPERKHRSEMRSNQQEGALTFGALQATLLKRINKGELKAIRLEISLAELGGRISKSKLKKNFEQNVAVKMARKLNWGSLAKLIDELVAGNRLVGADNGPASITLGQAAIVLRRNLSKELFQILAAKEAYVFSTIRNKVSMTAFDREVKGFIVAFGIYCSLSDLERENVRRFYELQRSSDAEGYFQFLKIFGQLYAEILQRPSTDPESALRNYVHGIYPEIEKEKSDTIMADSVAPVEANDLRDPLDPEFLRPTAANPVQVSREGDSYVFIRSVPQLGTWVSVRVAPADAAKRTEFLRIYYKKSEWNSVRSLWVRCEPDQEYGLAYRASTNYSDVANAVDQYGRYGFGMENMPGGRIQRMNCLTTYLRSVQNALHPLPEGQDRDAALAAIDNLEKQMKGPFIGRSESDGTELIFYDKQTYEKRQVERQEEERERQMKEQERLAKRFTLEGARVVIVSHMRDEGTRSKAEALRDALKTIGFLNVSVESGSYGLDGDVMIFFERELEGDFWMEYDAASYWKERYRDRKVFNWGLDGRRFSEVVHRGRYEPSAAEDAVMGNITPVIAAEFITRQTVTSLRDQPGALISGAEAVVTLPPYEPSVQRDEENEADGGKLRAAMAKLLAAAEAYVYRSSLYERSLVENTQLKITRRPSYKFEEGTPFLIFEGLSMDGTGRGMRLREEDEIEISFDGSDRTYRAVVIEHDGGRLVCSVPHGLDLKKDLSSVTGGSIKKKYNDVPAEVQQEFLHEVMESIQKDGADDEEPGSFTSSRRRIYLNQKYPLVAIALGLAPVEVTPEKDKQRMALLANPAIRTNEQQMKLLASVLNGRSIEFGWGPPGTGKTFVSGEILYQNWAQGKTQLVAAQTNRAVDNLLLQAKSAGVKVYRIGNHWQVIDRRLLEDWIDPRGPRKPRDLRDDSAMEKERFSKETEKYKEDLKTWEAKLQNATEDIVSGRAVVGGTCMGIAMSRFLNRIKIGHFIPYGEESSSTEPFQFDIAVIEEASVASFAELLIVLGKAKKKALIIGDDKQLGVSPMQPELEEELLTQLDEEDVQAVQSSLYEFLLNRRAFNVTMLQDCYRMTPLLVDVTNFNYDGHLRAMRNVSDEQNRRSLIVIDTKNIPYRKPDDPNHEITVGTSSFNRFEADLTLDIVEGLGRQAEIDSDGLGVITPYNAQITYLRDGLRQMIHQDWQGRDAAERSASFMGNVGTVWPFQGREKPVILISAVRSNPASKSGFVSWKMWNVMTSRAQECLIVILNSETFLHSRSQERVPEFMQHMLRLAKEKGTYIELNPANPRPNLSAQFSFLKNSLRNGYKGKMPFLRMSQEARHSRSEMRGDTAKQIGHATRTSTSRQDFPDARKRRPGLLQAPAKKINASSGVPMPADLSSIFSMKESVLFSIEAKDLAELPNWKELLWVASLNPRKLFFAVTGPVGENAEARIKDLRALKAQVYCDGQLGSFSENVPVFHFGDGVGDGNAVRLRISRRLRRSPELVLKIQEGSFLIPALLLDAKIKTTDLKELHGFFYDDGHFTGRFLDMIFKSFIIISASA